MNPYKFLCMTWFSFQSFLGFLKMVDHCYISYSCIHKNAFRKRNKSYVCGVTIILEYFVYADFPTVNLHLPSKSKMASLMRIISGVTNVYFSFAQQWTFVLNFHQALTKNKKNTCIPEDYQCME